MTAFCAGRPLKEVVLEYRIGDEHFADYHGAIGNKNETWPARVYSGEDAPDDGAAPDDDAADEAEDDEGGDDDHSRAHELNRRV